MLSGDDFYQNLEGFADFQEFPQLEHYQTLPDDWWVAITDVVDSTRAIREGRYKEVNAVGVASIAAVLNAVKPIGIPYVFGGDGATFCIPPSQRQPVASALLACQTMAAAQFGLSLRVGMVPMAAIKAVGLGLLIGKYWPYDGFQQAMFAGDGLSYAESLLKNADADNPYLLTGEESQQAADFSGYECRWNEIPSPHEEIISLLVQSQATDAAARQALYQSIGESINEIYGAESQCHPLREERLGLGFSPAKLATEIKIRTAGQGPWQRWRYGLKLLWLSLLGQGLMRLGVVTRTADWGLYKQRLIANTDYRKFDNTLRMVLSGTAAQRLRLREALELLRKDRLLVFGLHAAPTALITCIIDDYDLRHVHFLDGADGGYAVAAEEMKRQKLEFKNA